MKGDVVIPCVNARVFKTVNSVNACDESHRQRERSRLAAANVPTHLEARQQQPMRQTRKNVTASSFVLSRRHRDKPRHRRVRTAYGQP